MHLLQEYCTGGSVYDRILERQYFTEQDMQRVGISMTHPSRDVIFFGQNMPKRPPKIITSHDILDPSKQELLLGGRFRYLLSFSLFWGGGKGEASEEATRGAGLNRK